MKAKQLFILALLAAAFAGWTLLTYRQRAHTKSDLIGTSVLSDFSLNDVSKIVFSSRGTKVVVAKIDGTWLVQSRYNYPASFDKIVNTLKQLNELTVGQVVNIPAHQLGELNLLAPEESRNGGIGTLVELMDAQENVLSSMIIGKPFMRRVERGPQILMDEEGYPEGQYVRREDDMVFLISEMLEHLKEGSETWLLENAIKVPTDNIVKITSSGPNRETINLVKDQNNALKLAGLDKATEAMEVSKVAEMARSLRFFLFDDVASPELSSAETGLNQPIIFTAYTRNGQIYSLEIGKHAKTAGVNRYIRASVSYDPEYDSTLSEEDEQEAESMQKKTEALNTMLSPWVHVIRSSRIRPLLFQREDLVSNWEDSEDSDEEYDQE